MTIYLTDKYSYNNNELKNFIKSVMISLSTYFNIYCYLLLASILTVFIIVVSTFIL